MLSLRQDRRQQEALKVAIAATLAGFIILCMHADNPFWAPALVIVFMSEYFESSISASIERIVSAFFGGFFAIYAAHFTLHNEFLFVLLLAFIVALSVYAFLIYGSGWLNFSVTFSFIYLYLLYYPHGGFDIAYWRVFQVTLAAIIWVLVSGYIFPNLAQQSARLQFSQYLKQLADYLDQELYQTETTWETTKATLSQPFAALNKAIAALPSTGSNASKSIAAQNAIASLQATLRAIGKLLNSAEFTPSDYHNFFTRISHALQTLAASAFKRDSLEQFHDTLDGILAELTEYNTAQNQLISHELLTHVFDGLFSLSDDLLAWQTGSHCIQTQRRQSFWRRTWHDLRARPERVRHSICAGLGTALVVIIWFTTSWEGGICAVVSALVVGADFSLQKINMKIGLRFYGSFTGSLVAMLLVIFVTKNTPMLFICLFVGVLLFGYLATGNFKQMYFSWMATMSYVITLIPSNSMVSNFDFMVERSVGLLFGLAVMWFVMNFFFQINPDQVMKRHRNRMYGKLAEFLQLLAQLAQGNKGAQQQLTYVIAFLREQASVSDTLAKETGHSKDWQPTREILLRVFWCYRYLLKTTVLDNHTLDEEQLETFIANCGAAANHLHPHLDDSPWPAATLTELPEDPAATLFLREFNELVSLAKTLPDHSSTGSESAAQTSPA